MSGCSPSPPGLVNVDLLLVYMKVAFEAVWHRGDPISECLGLAQSITSGRPAVSKIWQYSSFKSILDGHLLQVRNFKEKACTGIIEGDFFPHSPAVSHGATQ